MHCYDRPADRVGKTTNGPPAAEYGMPLTRTAPYGLPCHRWHGAISLPLAGQTVSTVGLRALLGNFSPYHQYTTATPVCHQFALAFHPPRPERRGFRKIVF